MNVGKFGMVVVTVLIVRELIIGCSQGEPSDKEDAGAVDKALDGNADEQVIADAISENLKIKSLVIDPATLGEGDSATITTLLSIPSWIVAETVAGTLMRGEHLVAEFVGNTDTEYEASVTFSQLLQATDQSLPDQPIEISLTAVFTADPSAEVSDTLNIQLSCASGLGICENACMDYSTNLEHCGHCDFVCDGEIDSGSVVKKPPQCKSGHCGDHRVSVLALGRVSCGEMCQNATLKGQAMTCSPICHYELAGSSHRSEFGTGEFTGEAIYSGGTTLALVTLEDCETVPPENPPDHPFHLLDGINCCCVLE